MRFLGLYFRRRRLGLLIFALFCLVFLGAFALYRIPAGAVLYPALVCAVLGAGLMAWDFFRTLQKHRRLQRLQTLPGTLIRSFPETDGPIEEDYRELAQALMEENRRQKTEMDLRYGEMVDYYTVWAHQIKTPIASMKLTLQNEDSALSRRLDGELFRIEQYVEMVLAFLRLDAESTDYLLQEYDLDGIVRQAVKKFAGQFIGRKIRLVYEPLRARVVTDEKWLLFVIEQVISNALKYTRPGGTVTIDLEEPKTLCIRDTGIGIAPEDLPRIFEKGYTGYNGRGDKKASGIGLYLCRRVCASLGHRITADSSLDSGTNTRSSVEQKKLETE